MSDDVTDLILLRIAEIDKEIGRLEGLREERRRLDQAVRLLTNQVLPFGPQEGEKSAKAREWVESQGGSLFSVAELKNSTEITNTNAAAFLKRIGAIRHAPGWYYKPKES